MSASLAIDFPSKICSKCDFRVFHKISLILVFFAVVLVHVLHFSLILIDGFLLKKQQHSRMKNWNIISINCAIFSDRNVELYVKLAPRLWHSRQACEVRRLLYIFHGFSFIFVLAFCAPSFQTFPFYNRFFFIIICGCRCVLVFMQSHFYRLLLVDTFIVLLLLMSYFYTRINTLYVFVMKHFEIMRTDRSQIILALISFSVLLIGIFIHTRVHSKSYFPQNIVAFFYGNPIGNFYILYFCCCCWIT